MDGGGRGVVEQHRVFEAETEKKLGYWVKEPVLRHCQVDEYRGRQRFREEDCGLGFFS